MTAKTLCRLFVEQPAHRPRECLVNESGARGFPQADDREPKAALERAAHLPAAAVPRTASASGSTVLAWEQSDERQGVRGRALDQLVRIGRMCLTTEDDASSAEEPGLRSAALRTSSHVERTRPRRHRVHWLHQRVLLHKETCEWLLRQKKVE